MSGRRHPPAWFVRWYFAHVIGRWCPCEWPKWLQRFGFWKRLVYLCARLDDENERLDFIRFAAFYLPQTTSTATNITSLDVKWTRPHGRRREGSGG